MAHTECDIHGICLQTIRQTNASNYRGFDQIHQVPWEIQRQWWLLESDQASTF